jgi:CheY-like chemotaxis protein
MDKDHKASILVIEDNPGDVQLLQLALQQAEVNCNLRVFQHGGEALAFIKQYRDDTEGGLPDLAVVDLNLPQNDGIEILEAMQSSATFASVPIAVFSSSSLPRERARMEALRISHYIVKPADLDGLLAVGRLLKETLAQGGCSK